jgi:SagB-type dehydrogenase family enzyme
MPSLDIGFEFVEKTKLKYQERSEEEMGVSQPPTETPFPEHGEPISLPDPPDTDLKRIIQGRRSRRRYTAVAISLEDLSYLLWCVQGVSGSDEQRIYRTVPSAGGRYPLETFVLANRVEGLAPGIYHFRPFTRQLHGFIPGPEVAQQVLDASLRQPFVTSCAAFFIWVADVGRMTWRYQERGFRYLFMDAGHTCQNLYLAAESIGCGACAVAAYDDDSLNALFNLDGRKQFVIYMAAVGKKP